MAPSGVRREVAAEGALKRVAGEAPGREGPAPPQAAPGRGLACSSGSRPAGWRALAPGWLRVSSRVPPVGKSWAGGVRREGGERASAWLCEPA